MSASVNDYYDNRKMRAGRAEAVGSVRGRKDEDESDDLEDLGTRSIVGSLGEEKVQLQIVEGEKRSLMINQAMSLKAKKS
nr:1356_t:CDS:2 [Entrophospora candida]